ncbi:uncharacterized protein TRAVEDRAFT_38267 [Trametes versicolor FP-101664 SS1]|uniref:uncharacterized protein n=1 Tax=Trametes versicolor (strain FP-101664) TaxID=717944 RepID=UPI00046246E9|nr:uncharacterized protein TRAVEDRAFT_38267 [Trametes versicolor FP-101664 SS1]EIW57955.1 hypothetical protein TRAVEDRAFT_38267 [Trametes versicolor FP-101664 SS1]
MTQKDSSTAAQLSPRLKEILASHTGPAQDVSSLKKTSHVLSYTLEDAKEKKVEGGWLVLMTCALATANSTTITVGHLYRMATRQDPEDAATRHSLADAVHKAALMREAILKATLIIGVPRTILAMARLHEALEEDVKDNLRKSELRKFTPENVNEFKARGNALADSIYGPQSDGMRAKLRSYHPDFTEAVTQIYAAVFASFPEEAAVQGNLSRALNSVVAIACLRTEGSGVGELLNGHALGLLRARDEPGLPTEDCWLASEEGLEWVLATVDMLLDVLRSGGSD